MKFEVGKYYKHTSGDLMAIRCEVNTTMWGRCLAAEITSDIFGLVPVNNDSETTAVNWTEIDAKEWEKYFNNIS